ncbi:fibronectin type III domain-containing protein [Candidatus Peregrinibacteria bacterium]|nr:fibronectin type III domain-containing protein [Candidatus Peregrinibacteria bacterium]
MKNTNAKLIKIVAMAGVAVALLANANVVYSQAPVDALEPSDVENLKATPGDGEVYLTWDASTDNVGVTGYKIYRGTHSVKTTDDQYDLPVVPVGNVRSYTVKNLTNGQVYYFSATALDAAGNESNNWAAEAGATPESGLAAAGMPQDDGQSPQIKEIKSEDVVTVNVVFTEAVKLPIEHPASAFVIEKIANKSKLEVQKAEIDARDSTGATVLLTTAPQEAGVDYLVTAGVEIQDASNNPVNSGTSDTGSFKGGAKKKPEQKPAAQENMQTPATGDTEAPVLTAGAADFNNRITVSFSEPVKLPAAPRSSFAITKKGTDEKLNVLNVSLSVDGKTIFITTDPQKMTEYDVKVFGVTDTAGNALSAQADSVTVTGRGASMEDMAPPEEITKLAARIKGATTNLVELKWKAGKNSSGDLADQLLYQSNDKKGKDFGKPTSVGSSTTAVEVQDLKPGSWYTFKITTKDTSDNESKGVMTSIYLPQTGPGVLVAGFVSLLTGWYSRKKNTHERSECASSSRPR